MLDSSSRSQLSPPSPQRARGATRALLFGTCLALMGGAFVAAAKVESPAADPIPGASGAERLRPPPTIPAPTATTTPSAERVVAADAPVKTPEDVARMPELKGKRLSVALREAKRLGLRLAVRDDEGNRPLAGEGSFYRVRRQSVAAGEPLPKDHVNVVVRPAGEISSGY